MIWIRAAAALVPAVFWLGRLSPAPAVPIPLTLSFAASSVVGGNATTATIALGSVAPAGGTIVT